MKFTQLIEFQTSRIDEVSALMKQWRDAEGDDAPDSVGQMCKDRDRPDTYVAIVTFDSWDDAQRNNKRPLTQEYSAKLTALSESVEFRNLDVVQEEV
jgi:hypothetical protein